MGMRLKRVLAQPRWLAVAATSCFLAFSTPPADQGFVVFQESAGLSESAKELVAHWRKTTIVFESPRDEHLVLHADGTAENWVVTASDRTETKTGHWSVEGKTLHLDLGEDHRSSRPFTLHEGQLVLPNIQGRRQFWEKIE